MYNVCVLVQLCVYACVCREEEWPAGCGRSWGRGGREHEQQASRWRLSTVSRRRLLLHRLLHRLGLSLAEDEGEKKVKEQLAVGGRHGQILGPGQN